MFKKKHFRSTVYSVLFPVTLHGHPTPSPHAQRTLHSGRGVHALISRVVFPDLQHTTHNTQHKNRAPSELALGNSPRQAVGIMDSYLLVVSGVNPRWGDQSESAVVVQLARGTTAQPHQNQGKWVIKTIRLLSTRLALGPEAGLAIPVKVVSP
jgi:hypothetical protein